jgi:hypothetical protein
MALRSRAGAGFSGEPWSWCRIWNDCYRRGRLHVLEKVRAAGFVDIRRAQFGDSEDHCFKEVEDLGRWQDCLSVDCTAAPVSASCVTPNTRQLTAKNLDSTGPNSCSLCGECNGKFPEVLGRPVSAYRSARLAVSMCPYCPPATRLNRIASGCNGESTTTSRMSHRHSLNARGGGEPDRLSCSKRSRKMEFLRITGDVAGGVHV